MRNKTAIYSEIDEETYKQFRLKCLLNGFKQKEVIQHLLKEWVKVSKNTNIKIKPIIKKKMKGVKIEYDF